MTSNKVNFVSLADTFSVQFSNILKLPSGMAEWKTKQFNGPGNYRELKETVSCSEIKRRNLIIIIITLFESQIILAEHECSTNWGDCKSNKSNQIKCRFLRRGENRSSRRKTSRSRVENQQTQPTYDAGSGNRTRDTLVEGERSHHHTNPAPRTSNELAGVVA